jgi:thioredoxin-like negative regulator of GroEL
MVKVIKFYADWCGPCQAYDEIWNKVKKGITEGVEFVNINVDKDTTGLAADYKVRSIPYTVIIKKGEETKHVGLLQEQQLKDLILN